MTEKRTLTQDEPASRTANGDRISKKRRKIAHRESTSKPEASSPQNKRNSSHAKATESPKEAKQLVKVPSSGAPQEPVSVQDKEANQSLVAKSKSSSGWCISRCRSGRFLNLDPVFTADGRHIILATEDEAQVFAISTSRLVRTLSINDAGRLTALKLSHGNSLFVSSYSGSLVQWDWETGAEVQTYKISRSTIAFDIAAADEPAPHERELLFAIGAPAAGKREISLNVLSAKGGCHTSVVLDTAAPISDLKVLDGGRTVLTWAGDSLLVGYLAERDPGSLDDPVIYTWREVRLPGQVTCLDVRVIPGHESGFLRVDVVLGQSTGPILICNDILNRLLRCETGESDNNLVSSRLHWHRKAVNAVKWSKDGNYVISGGSETVLVLWQLDTGRKQFLPHLSSAIRNIAVSPAGSAYALKLADNSAMVLSTSELRPVASMSGLQLPLREDILGRPAQLNKHQIKAGAVSTQPCDRLPALLHPTQPDYLVAAVPSTQLLASPDSAPSSSLLQTFDIRSGHHVSRQALTRTNVSVLNSGPQGTELTAPDVKFIQISPDGDWLATIDDWDHYPEAKAVLCPQADSRGCRADREEFLKFWHWNADSSEWQLATRIDSPHANPSQWGSHVVDLATHPTAPTFATIGSDAVVRIWSPGKQARGRESSKEGQRTAGSWKCSQTVILRRLENISTSVRARVSFSSDGSVLAACWQGTSRDEPGLVHLIDPATGDIRCSRAGLCSGAPAGMGFVDRCLIIVSESLLIWDTVADEVMSSLLIDGRSENTLFAVNPRSKTFAVAVSPTPAKDRDARATKSDCECLVFDATSLQPVFHSSLKSLVRTLLPDPRSGDYVIVDAAAQVMRIAPSEKTRTATRAYSDTNMLPQTGLENLFGGFSARSEPAANDFPEAGVQNTRDLTDIFEVAPSFALPAVDVLFKNVVDLLKAGPVQS